MDTLTPAELRARIDAGDELVLLDVREDQEVATCALPGSVHVPLGELPARMDELEPDATVVCICHHGIRSAHAGAFLEANGFRRVINLSGGIDRYALEVDPSMARY